MSGKTGEKGRREDRQKGACNLAVSHPSLSQYYNGGKCRRRMRRSCYRVRAGTGRFKGPWLRG